MTATTACKLRAGMPVIQHGPLFSEVRPWCLVAEIAEVNHECGFEGFPEKFFLARGDDLYGNEQHFVPINVDRRNGELVSVTYKQLMGLTTVKIFND